MTVEVLIAFIAACLLLGLTPGPNMSLIVANTLSTGLAAGLFTLAGTTTGLALLVAAAVIGMSSVMVFMSEWFDVVRCVGRALPRLAGRPPAVAVLRAPSARSAAAAGLAAPIAFCRGCWSACRTPRCCCSLAPSCRSSSIRTAIAVGQLSVLAILFVVVLAAVDVGYTLAVARARATL